MNDANATLLAKVERSLDYLIEAARRSKVSMEVLATAKKSTAIAFQQRQMEQFALSETFQMGVRVLDGHHEGVAYTESLQHDSLDEMLASAQANARMIEKPWIAQLHGATTLRDLHGLYNAQLENIAVNNKVEAAAQLESAALDFSPEIKSVAYTRYADAANTVWVANTNGLRGSYRQNYCLGYTYCLANDGEHSVMGGEIEAHRDFRQLNVQKIARQAAEKALARRGAVRPETGRYTVVFENRMAERLFDLVAAYFSAKAVDENKSPLRGKLGHKIFSSELNVMDDPFFISATGSRPFDDEGYAAQKTTLIDQGVVTSFLTNSVLARKMALPHTASASRSPSTDLDVSPSNILLRPGSYSRQQLLEADRRVILITNILGFAGFRHTSGDFSLPVEGHLYENGKVIVPLKDFLLSGNILQLLSAVEGVANDQLMPVGNVVCPSILIRDVNVAGKS